MIVESNRYMVLGTSDEAGVPWVTPLWYAQADLRDFFWVSSPDRRHSRNVTARPEVSIAIFDPTVEVGGARGIYMAARAAQVAGADLEGHLARFNDASRRQGLTGPWLSQDVLAPAAYRLYRAAASRQWVLDPDSTPDARVEVRL